MKREIYLYRTTDDAAGIDLSSAADDQGADTGSDDQDTGSDTGADDQASDQDAGDDKGADDQAGDNSDDSSDDTDDKGGDDEPITYTIPEGLEEVFEDQESFDEATEFARSIGLSQEQFDSTFQYLMDNVSGSFHENIADYKQRNQEGLNTLREELGATGYDQTMANAAKVVNAVGDKDFVELLERSDMGNNPVMAKFLGSLGALLSEDGLSMISGQDEPRPVPNAAGGDDALAKKFYPNMK